MDFDFGKLNIVYKEGLNQKNSLTKYRRCMDKNRTANCIFWLSTGFNNY